VFLAREGLSFGQLKEIDEEAREEQDLVPPRALEELEGAGARMPG
jgi:hypothetical protein